MEIIGNKVWDEVRYEQMYNIDTGEFSCTCRGFTMRRRCWHVSPEWVERVLALVKSEKEMSE